MRARLSNIITSLADLRPLARVLNAKANQDLMSWVNEKTSWLPKDCKVTQRAFVILNDISEPPKCSHCDLNPTRFIDFVIGYVPTCSPECARDSGVGIERAKKTMMERYGVDNPGKRPELQKKLKKARDRNNDIKRIGGVNDAIEALKEANITFISKKSSCKSNWTFKCVECDTVFERTPRNVLLSNERNGRVVCVDCANETGNNNKKRSTRDDVLVLVKERGLELLSEVKDKVANLDRLRFKCSSCTKEFDRTIVGIKKTKSSKCPSCLRLQFSSKMEEEMAKFIQGLGFKVEKNNRTLLSPKEIDVYVPSAKLGIEMNGLYWHSDIFKDKNYHLNKTILAEKNGIQILHVFEDEWANKRPIVENMIRNKLGINSRKFDARKMKIVKIEFSEVSDFYERSHLQGSCGASFHIALKDKKTNELVAAMSVGKNRFAKGFEIIRFASSLNTSVRGGFSKLLKEAKSLLPVGTELWTFADRRYSTGNVYVATGFKLAHTTRPSYFYTDYVERFNRMKFQKHKLSKLLYVYDESLSETDNMTNNGYFKVWDCGQLAFSVSL